MSRIPSHWNLTDVICVAFEEEYDRLARGDDKWGEYEDEDKTPHITFLLKFFYTTPDGEPAVLRGVMKYQELEDWVKETLEVAYINCNSDWFQCVVNSIDLDKLAEVVRKCACSAWVDFADMMKQQQGEVTDEDFRAKAKDLLAFLNSKPSTRPAVPASE